MSNHVLSVVIPALDEEDGIADIIERVLSVKEPLAAVGVSDLELIVVDDGSTDRTPEIIRTYPEVVLIQHPINRGYGAAIKTGFRDAKGTLLAFLDADGTYPPEYFPQLCEPIVKGEADLVTGTRMVRDDSGMPITRYIGNTIFATLVSVISGRKVTDSATGQRVLKKELLEILYPLPDGLNFTPVMTTRAMHEDIEIVEVPIKYEERVGDSKLSVVKDGLRFLNTILMTALTYNPARIFGLVGVSLVALGGLATSWRTVRRSPVKQEESQLVSWFVGLVLGSAGINIFSIGATFNYIISIFHNRPIRQGVLGHPLFRTPIEKLFGWVGVFSVISGVFVYAFSTWKNWTKPGRVIAPWFPAASSTILVLTGIQLITSWLLTLVLSELTERDNRTKIDLGS